VQVLYTVSNSTPNAVPLVQANANPDGNTYQRTDDLPFMYTQCSPNRRANCKPNFIPRADKLSVMHTDGSSDTGADTMPFVHSDTMPFVHPFTETVRCSRAEANDWTKIAVPYAMPFMRTITMPFMRADTMPFMRADTVPFMCANAMPVMRADVDAESSSNAMHSWLHLSNKDPDTKTIDNAHNRPNRFTNNSEVSLLRTTRRQQHGRTIGRSIRKTDTKSLTRSHTRPNENPK
jgi:hypothetical protein